MAATQYVTLAYSYDQNKIQEHSLIAQQVIKDMQKALDQGLIPDKYQNQTDISNIMNVILQGENNTTNKDIYTIGMNIYNTYHPDPHPDPQAVPTYGVTPVSDANSSGNNCDEEGCN